MEGTSHSSFLNRLGRPAPKEAERGVNKADGTPGTSRLPSPPLLSRIHVAPHVQRAQRDGHDVYRV